MLNQFHIHSDLSFSQLFCEVGAELSSSHTPMALMNLKDMIMMPLLPHDKYRAPLCFPSVPVDLLSQEIVSYHSVIPLFKGIHFIRIEKNNLAIDPRLVSEFYIHFCVRIIEKIMDVFRDAARCVYKHLSLREYDALPLTKIPAIQFEFAYLYTSLESIQGVHKKNREIV
jgi:hypothetical protein